ncbi:MAG: hypothetical protein ACREBS_03345 [Nitrososphaerales archaeon]
MQRRKKFGEAVNLDEIPTPLWHELDGGKFSRHNGGMHYKTSSY